MKTKIMLFAVCVMALFAASCSTQYKKTKSGLVYKIFPGDSKDSFARANDVVKFHIVWKLKDSVLFDSHGKMPQYSVVSDRLKDSYSYLELLPLLKKGDSAVVLQSVDTLFKKGLQEQFAFAKKGDRLNIYVKVLDVFRSDSVARADAEATYEKFRPMMEKERLDAMSKEKEKEDKELQAYFSAKKIQPQKAPQGTYVLVNEKGSGEPATVGKYITVKYDGKLISNDERFDAGVYTFVLGTGNAIQGWHDGIPFFNKGGKGVLYIPGVLAYGDSQQSPGGPFAALKFDVEILNISDTEDKAKVADSIARKQVQIPAK